VFVLKAPYWIFIFFIFLVVAGCERDVPIPEQNLTVVPAHFPASVYPIPTSHAEKKQAELGRRLFYETLLSQDSSISCASCHLQSAGFSDPGKQVSKGVNGLSGIRNSPSLANLAWFPSFMWDGGVNHIEVMPVAPISDPVEMNLKLADLLQRLNSNAQYGALFKEAFGESSINSQNLLVSFARFMASMISAGSAYDSFVTGTSTALNAQEKSGLLVFRTRCSSCHTEPLFTDFSYRNNGIAFSSVDSGRQRVTQQVSDKGKFKVPSLRNVAVSPPYMHDGRFQTLEEVLTHYVQPQNASYSDALIGTGIALSASERQALLSFMNTLTDYSYLSNKNLGSPFN
jgi:cytochrome c peroxidase